MFFYRWTALVSGLALVHSLEWERRSSYDSSPDEFLGRHHPITFANETHGFLLGGSTLSSEAVDDFHIYREATNEWIDVSAAARDVFPARTYGYGVVLDQSDHPKAYLGFGSDATGRRLNDWWELDMATLEFRELASCPGEGRHHPSMVPVYNTEDNGWEIHVGLGDGLVGEGQQFTNFNDYWSYDVSTDVWTQLPDFPGSKRHHPFFFGMHGVSYVGLGHSDGFNPYIERDFYSYSSGVWFEEPDFASYAMDDNSTEPTLVTTEARVAGTQFSIVLPLRGADDDNATATTDESRLEGSIGFVLSGDGDDHKTMEEGEFHAFYPASHGLPPLPNHNNDTVRWRQLPPHPGRSRWAPGSFVMRGTARAYFTSGYDRTTMLLHSDVWSIDLSPLFRVAEDPVETNPPTTTVSPTAQEESNVTTSNENDVEEVESNTAEEQDVTSDSEVATTRNGSAESPSSAGVARKKWSVVLALAGLGIGGFGI